jgi:hypothetical protein
MRRAFLRFVAWFLIYSLASAAVFAIVYTIFIASGAVFAIAYSVIFLLQGAPNVHHSVSFFGLGFDARTGFYGACAFLAMATLPIRAATLIAWMILDRHPRIQRAGPFGVLLVSVVLGTGAFMVRLSALEQLSLVDMPSAFLSMYGATSWVAFVLGLFLSRLLVGVTWVDAKVPVPCVTSGMQAQEGGQRLSDGRGLAASVCVDETVAGRSAALADREGGAPHPMRAVVKVVIVAGLAAVHAGTTYSACSHSFRLEGQGDPAAGLMFAILSFPLWNALSLLLSWTGWGWLEGGVALTVVFVLNSLVWGAALYWLLRFSLRPVPPRGSVRGRAESNKVSVRQTASALEVTAGG